VCFHSCFTRYSPKTLLMEVVSYKNIEPGEELSLSCQSPPPSSHTKQALYSSSPLPQTRP
jgi:hypothetical protein